MKKILIFLVSSLFAVDFPASKCTYLPINRGCQTLENFMNNKQIYGWFDFLYWEGTERGLEFAVQNRGTSFVQDLKICEPNFGFNAAFRIGLGTHLSYDFWSLEAVWTRYYTRTFDFANGKIFSVWSCAAAFSGNHFLAIWQDAQAKWNLHVNILDLDLKHLLHLTAKVSFEPKIGVKFALLQQAYKTVYENGNTILIGEGEELESIQFISSNISMNNRSLNIGPCASVTTRWNISDSFDVIGGLSGSLLASRFSIKRFEWDAFSMNGDQFDSIRERQVLWISRPQVAATFGIGWTQCYCQKNRTVTYGISASYEAQVFWKQNMLFRFIDQTNASMVAPSQGNLYLQGLTIHGFIDF